MPTTDTAWPEEVIVSVDWLRNHFDDSRVRVVDVRPLPQYAAGHIPGALHSGVAAIKLTSSAPAAIAEFEQHISRELQRIGIVPEERVVFYEDVTGTAAARAVWLLDYAGQKGGALLDGGLVAWIEAGGQLSTEHVTAKPSDTDFTLDRSVLATADEIVVHLRNDSAVLLDTRADQEYDQSAIPGARHIEWINHLTPRGALRSPAEIRALYAAHGLTFPQSEPVITYCASGYRAAHSYVVLKALGQQAVTNYAPSWGEWGARVDLPKERPATEG